MNDAIQQTAAETATEAAIEAVVTHAPPEKTEAAFNRASIEHRRSAPSEDGTPAADQTWRDGHETLAPMPDAPHVATSEVDVAIAKLNERGDDHAALVQSWGSDFGDNLGFAKAAFKEIADTNPGLIAKFERNGLGDHPAVLQFLAKHGRLSAGMMGDFPTRNNEPMTINRTGPTGTNRGGSAREELDRIMSENPPGSVSYKTPSVQRRIEALSRQIAGNEPIIGSSGRTS
jgi:hypothetical protein